MLVPFFLHNNHAYFFLLMEIDELNVLLIDGVWSDHWKQTQESQNFPVPFVCIGGICGYSGLERLDWQFQLNSEETDLRCIPHN